MPRPKRLPPPPLPKAAVDRLADLSKPQDVKLADLTKRPRGHRPAAIDYNETTLKLLTALGQVQCTYDDLGGVFGCGATAVANFFEREPTAKEVYEQAMAQGRASLRVLQFQHAKKNVAMAIFLGKNLLGQKDVVDYIKPPVADATESAIEKLARRFERVVKQPAAAGTPPRNPEAPIGAGSRRVQ